MTVWGAGSAQAGTMEERTFVSGAVVAYQSQVGATLNAREYRFQHVDRLGSVEAVTKDGVSAVLNSIDLHGFDPWGKPRAGDWSGSGERLHASGEQGATSDRGFTGHEHLDPFFLIHMNGRVYDYRLGRFLSVDPIISNPANSQSINPYSYIGNNPLSGTDPTGYDACPAGQADKCVGDGKNANKPNSMVEARREGSIAGRAGDRVISGDLDRDVTGSNASRPMNNGFRDAGTDGRTSKPVNVESPAEVNAARQRLIAAQDEARGNPDFQPGAGGDGMTHCNQATCRIVADAGGPTGDLTSRDHKPALANEQGLRLATSTAYRKVDPIEAQSQADQGKPVVGTYINPNGHGHAVTVRPTGVPGDNPHSGFGPLINDIGGDVRIERGSRVFPAGANVNYYAPKDPWSDAGAGGYR